MSQEKNEKPLVSGDMVIRGSIKLVSTEACEKQGMVLYSDGGYRQNFGGWGLHGYLYNFVEPKKLTGMGDYTASTMGYVLKTAEDAVIVTPVHYFDGYGAVLPPTTNNVAEMLATINGLRHAAKFEIVDLQVFTDSEYVRKGLEFWADGWKANGWLKNDQTPPANVELWKELVDLRDALVQRGVAVKINWVKGHNEILGNVQADRLATIGVMSASRNQNVSSIETAAAEGYWKYEVEKHPFISNRRMYFNTMSEFIRPGEYFLGEHGKDDDLLGKRISDGAYSVVILEKPDQVLEDVRNFQSSIAKSIDSIVMVRLDKLYRPDTHRELSTYGALAMEQADKYRLDLFCLDREPLTRELRPPKLAMRAVEAVSELAERMHQFFQERSGVPTPPHEVPVIATDITDILYEKVQKAGKKNTSDEAMKLKSKYGVGFAALQVDVNYQSGAKMSITKEPLDITLTGPADSIKSAPVTLTLGIDLLERNALKRLETLNPQVTVISWLEAPDIFRYATVFEVGNDKAIFAGCYSNIRIIK